MNFIKHILKKHFVSILSLGFLIVFATTLHSIAFNPGETLNPGCLPGAVGCSVTIPSSQWDNVTGGINFAGGYVGVGTTTPSGILDIRGGTSTSGNGTPSNYLCSKRIIR